MSFVKLPVLSNGLTIRHEDILPDTAIKNRIELLRKHMKEMNIDVLMIYRDGAVSGPVCYLTNYPAYRLGRSAMAVLGLKQGPFLYTADPSRNVPKVRRFTSCDLEGSKQFFSSACRQAKGLARSGAIGLVGAERFPMVLTEEMEKEFSGLEVMEISEKFEAVIAAKDESSLKAIKEALKLAEQGFDILKEQINSGKDLWRLSAYIDYRLRLLGCEDTNILLNCAAGGKMRPGYPTRIQPHPKDVIVAYIAVRYARHWGVVGRTLSVGSTHEALDRKLATLGEVQRNIMRKIRPEMTLEQVEAEIREEGYQQGLVFAKDLPLASGVGFDLSEFPLSAKDRVGNNTVLQVVLTVDPEEEETTAMRVDMLQVNDTGATWIFSLDG